MSRGVRLGWRLLALLWAVVLAGGACTAAALAVLGPPGPAPAASGAATPVVRAEPPAPPPAAPREPSTPVAAPAAAPATAPARGIASPDPALLEPSRLFAPAQLPRIATDGRASRTVYAARVPSGTGPRVAILLGTFAASEADSRAAIKLPGPVSFAVSAYAPGQRGLLSAAREAGHELFASIPMEPQGYPLNDEGTRSLLTGLSPDDNRQNLEWALSRFNGEVGATGASDGMRGERFADMPGAFDPILDEIARRGLLYLDPRPGANPARPGLVARAVDIVVDESPARADIEARLRDLERMARDHGSAIGLIGQSRPVTLDRLAAWADTLSGQGIVLVPVSALLNGPAKP